MTEAEERLYLEELLLESARWTRDPDEPYCSVELEIRDRLRKLNGVNTIDENGRCQSDPKPRPEHGHPGQIRVYDHGKSRWVKKELCEQVPCKNSKTGLKWVLKEVKDDIT
jgi:hypothetical protein